MAASYSPDLRNVCNILNAPSFVPANLILHIEPVLKNGEWRNYIDSLDREQSFDTFAEWCKANSRLGAEAVAAS